MGEKLIFITILTLLTFSNAIARSSSDGASYST